MACDLDRDDWRTLRLDRMSEVRATTWRFRPREAPDAAAYVQHAVSVSPYRYEARVLLHAPVAAIREKVSAASGRVDAVDEETCRLVAGANSLEAIAWHLVWLGAPFTVEAPDELRATLAELGARMMGGQCWSDFVG